MNLNQKTIKKSIKKYYKRISELPWYVLLAGASVLLFVIAFAFIFVKNYRQNHYPDEVEIINKQFPASEYQVKIRPYN